MAKVTWIVHGSEIVLRHPFISVEMQRVELPDGALIEDWPIVHTRDFVNVAVLNGRGDMLALEGYKHGLGRSSWQVPGGYLEEGEDPLAAAKRELLEETGYASDHWQALGSFVVDANRRVGVGHFFLARDVRSVSAPDPGDLEAFSIRWVPLAEVKEALADGRVGVMSYAVCMALALVSLGKPL